MDILLRQLTPGGGHSDAEHTTDRVTIGSAEDCLVQMPLAEPRHAYLELARAGLRLRSLTKQHVLLNGEPAARATLKIGDLLEVPGGSLQISEAPAGFDAMVTISRSEGYVAALSQQRLGLADTWLAKRPFTWITTVAVLVGLFALPFMFSGERAATAPVAALMSDQLWTSGDLHAAHALVTGDDCSGCHQQPFVRVKSEACGECHGAVNDHVSPEFVAIAGNSADFGIHSNDRCGVCHREHNEPSTLVSEADSDCVQCHGVSDGIHRDVDPLAFVGGFNSDSHPTYEYMLPRFDFANYAGSVDAGWRIEAVGEAAIPTQPESSNLLYPHDLHLDPAEVTDLVTNEALTCASCHRLAIDGEHFLPVTMEQHCQDCHQLDFDESDPDRSLPHARLKEAVHALEGMLLKKYFDPEDTGELFAYRRLPDRAARDQGCTDAPAVCVERELVAVVESQFEANRGCAECHNFRKEPASDIEDRYWVMPVRLPQDFVPDAQFDHVAHQVLRADNGELLRGDAACGTCHAATDSDKATQLLMPVMTTCYECHGDSRSSAEVALSCIDCHAYHPRDYQPRDRGFLAVPNLLNAAPTGGTGRE
jgi:predicted CXXCH cytochrome family protein